MVPSSRFAPQVRIDNQYWRIAGVTVVALVAVVVLAGCMGINGDTGAQSISDPRVTVSENDLTNIAFNYSINDDANALLKGPDGSVLTERALQPDKTQSSIYLGEPTPGQYKLVLQQGENTIASQTLTFEGDDVTITAINDSWNNDGLETVTVKLRNNGDLPTETNITVRHSGDTLVSSSAKMIPPNESISRNLTASTGSIYSPDSGGIVTLNVIADSAESHATQAVTRKVAGASVTIDSITPIWENSQLTEVTATVSNTGDVDAEGTIELAVNGNTVTSTTVQVDAGETSKTVTLGDDSQPAYIPERGGTYEVAVSVAGDGWHDSTESTTEFGSLAGELSNVSAGIRTTFGADTATITSVNFDVENTGAVPIRYNSVVIAVAEETQSVNTSQSSAVLPGAQSSNTVPANITVPEGKHNLTIRLLNDGETVISGNSTVWT